MDFKSFLLNEKWLNGSSVFCGHCKEALFPLKVIENLRHIYTIGQLWVCGVECHRSSIWTHSIRNPNQFIRWVEAGANPDKDRYYQGFCNDRFCGHCFSPLYPLENGVPSIKYWQTNRLDKFGCLKCKQNQDILIDGAKEYRENDYGSVIEWFKKPRNFEEVKRLAKMPHA